MSHRVTLREIAEASGFHFTTVSLALRNHPSIREKTREKIRKTADALGYRPDPVLSALVAYRHAKQTKNHAGTIAWLSNYGQGYHWRKIPLFRDYFEGAVQQAQLLGYRLEEFDLRSKGMNPRRAQEILYSRGIQGILIPPQKTAHSIIELDWSQFSAVSFGYTLEQPSFHVVSSNHFRMMVDLIAELHARDYQRIGLVMLRVSAERVENKWIAALLGESFLQRNALPFEPLLLDQWQADTFDAWFERHAPDVIVAGARQIPELLPHLEQRGIAIPRDLGFADHNLSDEDTAIAGMKQNGHLVGASAVSVLTSLINRNEKGIPTQRPVHTLVDGFYYDGPTLRSRS